MIDIPYTDLRAKFDEYFEANKNDIIQTYGIKGKKTANGKIPKDALTYEKRLGETTLYYDILTGIVAKHLDDLFFIEGVNLVNFKEGEETAHLVALFFRYPKLELLSDVDYTCTDPVKQDEAGAWADRMSEIQNKFRVLEDYMEKAVPTENAELLVDIISSQDGKPFPSYTFRRRWFNVNQLPKTLLETLGAHEVGDLFETTLDLPDIYSGATKAVQMHVKVYEAKLIKLPEVNDALAVQAGFESLEMLKNQFRVEFDEYVLRARKNAAIDHVINQLLQHSKLPQLPENCVFSNANLRMREHLEQYGGDKKRASLAVGAKTEDEMVHVFRRIVVKDILQQIALRKYAEIAGLSLDDPGLIDHMIEHVNFVA